MTTLDERLREADDALGDAPRGAPPFDALHRRHRRRRQRVLAVGAGAVSIVVVCVAVALAVRGPDTPPSASSTPSTTAASTTTTAAVAVQRLEDMPRLPDSAVRTVEFSRPIGNGRAVVADDGSLWFVDTSLNCGDNCGWLSFADLSNGRVFRMKSLPEGQGADPIAVGDGAVFIASVEYEHTPVRVTRFDIATRQTTFTVDLPEPQVFSGPKMRLAFDNGTLWLSPGTNQVVKVDPRTGRVLATIPLPSDGAGTAGDVGFAFDASGAWLVGRDDDTGQHLIHIDPEGEQATAVARFGTGFTQSLTVDGRYAWTTSWKLPAKGNPTLDLVRIDTREPHRTDIAGIATAQVAADDGQVWFLGYVPSGEHGNAANHYGVVGRVDPETMKVTGVIELPDIGPFDTPQLFVFGGSAWVVDSRGQTAARITSP